MKKHWYHYLWLWSLFYFGMGFFNILFAWMGLISFALPLIMAIGYGNKISFFATVIVTGGRPCGLWDSWGCHAGMICRAG